MKTKHFFFIEMLWSGDQFRRFSWFCLGVPGKAFVSNSKNKSNFRCALYALRDVVELTQPGDKSGENAKRTYQFIDKNDPRYGEC